jgi:hypothetical protein
LVWQNSGKNRVSIGSLIKFIFTKRRQILT